MGIFDKGTKRKKGDDFESPVEQIDLSTASAGLPAPGADDDDDDGRPHARRRATASPSMAPPQASSAPAASAAPAASVSHGAATATVAQSGATRPAAADDKKPAARRSPSYGIDDAIALMRSLPSDNVELVVQVVKHTLQSTHIEISSIIEDATEKQARIDARVKVLKGEIEDLEHEIGTRRREIDGLETDHRETTMVKDRLQLAERLATRGAEGSGGAMPRTHRATGELPRPRTPSQPPQSGAPAATPPAPSSGAVSTSPSPSSPPPSSPPPSSSIAGAFANATAVTSGSASPAPAAPSSTVSGEASRPQGHTVVVKK